MTLDYLINISTKIHACFLVIYTWIDEAVSYWKRELSTLNSRWHLLKIQFQILLQYMSELMMNICMYCQDESLSFHPFEKSNWNQTVVYCFSTVWRCGNILSIFAMFLCLVCKLFVDFDSWLVVISMVFFTSHVWQCCLIYNSCIRL